MKIPADLNLMRITGGILALPFVRAPRGFEGQPIQIEGDHQWYFARQGYRVERCPENHAFREGCAKCEPFHGAVAVISPIRQAEKTMLIRLTPKERLRDA